MTSGRRRGYTAIFLSSTRSPSSSSSSPCRNGSRSRSRSTRSSVTSSTHLGGSRPSWSPRCNGRRSAKSSPRDAPWHEGGGAASPGLLPWRHDHAAAVHQRERGEADEREQRELDEPRA